MRIATFNLQNLRLRHGPAGDRLQGAQDKEDAARRPDPALDEADRHLTAEVIRAIDADFIALQEVFDQESLDYLHDRYLVPTGARPYPHRVCLPGNDGQGLDVAAMSRHGFDGVTSHVHETATSLGLEVVPQGLGDQPLFRRDCLAITISSTTFFICHFKAPWPDAERSAALRRAEAEGVRRLIERQFPDPARGDWIVLGDLNRAADSNGHTLEPLTKDFGVDLMERLPEPERWTFRTHIGDRPAHPDAILLSPALAARFPDARPRIFRAGMDSGFAQAAGPAFSGVAAPRPHASDHAAVFVDLPGLTRHAPSPDRPGHANDRQRPKET